MNGHEESPKAPETRAAQAVTIVVTEAPPAPALAHPCATGRHRWAWLVDGRQACGYCGKPR